MRRQGYFYDHLISRLHRALETSLVNACEQIKVLLAGASVKSQAGKQRRGLGNAFQHQHPRENRAVRKVAIEKRFVDRYILYRRQLLPWNHIDYTVNQKEWIPVWQDVANLTNIEFLNHRLSGLHSL